MNRFVNSLIPTVRLIQRKQDALNSVKKSLNIQPVLRFLIQFLPNVLVIQLPSHALNIVIKTLKIRNVKLHASKILIRKVALITVNRKNIKMKKYVLISLKTHASSTHYRKDVLLSVICIQMMKVVKNSLHLHLVIVKEKRIKQCQAVLGSVNKSKTKTMKIVRKSQSQRNVKEKILIKYQVALNSVKKKKTKMIHLVKK